MLNFPAEYAPVQSKSKVALAVFAGAIGTIVAYVWAVNHDLVDPATRAQDLALLTASGLAGMVLISAVYMFAIAPALLKGARENPAGARGRTLVSLFLYLGMLAGLPWLIRWAWAHRTLLLVAIGTLFGMVVLAYLVFSRAVRRLRAARPEGN